MCWPESDPIVGSATSWFVGNFTAAPRIASDDLIRPRWCPVQRGGALERVVRGRKLSRKQDPLTAIPAFATARQQARGRKSSRRRPQCQAGSARGPSGNGARCSQRMEAVTSASHLSLHDGGGRRKSDTQCLQGPTVRRRTTQHVHISTYVMYTHDFRHPIDFHRPLCRRKLM